MPYVRIWIDASDVLGDMDDEDIRKEYRKRFMSEPDSGDDLMIEAIERIEKGDTDYGLYLLRQIAFPKFRSLEDCIKRVGSSRKGAPS